MQSKLNVFMMNSMHKAQRFLYRDFFELELSQSSKSTMEIFVAKAIARTEEMASTELLKHPYVGVVGMENPVPNKINFICRVEGAQNLERSLPFFSISLCAYKLDENGNVAALSCLISFPALGSVYYAEANQGAYLLNEDSHNKSIRLKTSKHQTPLMIATDYGLEDKIPSENALVRSFGSCSYSSCLLASGKVDLVISTVPTPQLLLPITLILKESGGTILQDNPLIMSNGYCKLSR